MSCLMKNCKNNFYILCLLGLLGTSITSYGQTKLIINGGYLIHNDNSKLVLENTQFINNGRYESMLGTIVVKGENSDEQSAIGGDSLSIFYNLEINKTANGAQLQRSIQVNNELLMTSGHLDLNGDTVTLENANGHISNESETNRIIGPNGGVIQKTLDLNAPSGINPGNLGATISSAANLGSTLIQREHFPQNLNDTLSIERTYKFFPTNNSNLNASVELGYLEAELNGHNESELGAWRRDSTFWYNPASTAQPNADRVVVDSVGFLTEWTLVARAPAVDLRVLLAGPYDVSSAEMTDDLRSSDLIPTTEPYTALGYDHPASGGGEQINPAILEQTGSNAIVDWVFVELRDSADVSNVIAARSALLQKDGDVVDLDGRSNLSFPEIATTETPLISIRHRNHIGIIAASTVDLSSGTPVLDFSANPDLAEGGAAALIDFGDGNYGLISGDFDGDGQIQNTDSNAQNQNLGSSGYLPGDSDLNGQVQNTDLQIKLTPNLGRGAQFGY